MARTFVKDGQTVTAASPTSAVSLLAQGWREQAAEDLTVAQLKDVADAEGVDVPSDAKKADLVKAVTNPADKPKS